MRGVQDRQIVVFTAELLVPEPSAFVVEVGIEKLERKVLINWY